MDKKTSCKTAYEAYIESVNSLTDDEVLEALDFMLNLKAKRTKTEQTNKE